MSEVLLSTKLNIPPLRRHLVARPHLLAQLDRGLRDGCRLALISAPAGFGKTTLVNAWADSLLSHDHHENEHVHGVAWLALDEGDNDPARFLSYLVASLNEISGIDTTVGRGALDMLPSDRSPPAEEILTSVINDIVNVPDRVIFVVDDFHLIDSAAIDDALSFLIDHSPPQLYLVLITRSDPALPLARYRARGQLSELRALDLRFTPAEAADYLNQVMGLDLSAADVATLEARTEGWIAGLQLAAISMHGRQEVAGFIQSFGGSHHYVMDYLVEDVLQQLPDDLYAFLLQTAMLDRMTGALCDALTGRSDGQETLERLERDNLFVVPLDQERRWYRYHHLFGDLLRRQLRQKRADHIPHLHRRAAEWHERNGIAASAIDHALGAGDYLWAAQLLDEHIDALWASGEHRNLSRWLANLPVETLLSRPLLAIFRARYQGGSGQLQEAEEMLAATERVLESDAYRADDEDSPGQIIPDLWHARARGRIDTTRALLASYRGDAAGIIRYARHALANLPEDDLTWRSVTAITLGNAYGFKGDMAAAYAARFQAAQACAAAGDAYFMLLSNLELAITLREQGRLRRTMEICHGQRQFARASGLSRSRLAGWLLAICAEAAAELGDLDTALAQGKEGLALSRDSGDMQMHGWAFMCLMRIFISNHDLDAAEAIVHEMEEIGRTSPLPPWVAHQVEIWRVRLWLAQENLDAASRWAVEREQRGGGKLVPAEEIGFFLLLEYITLARVLLAQGRFSDALALLQHVLRAAEAGDRMTRVIEIAVLQALCLQAGGDVEQALRALARALALGETEGFSRVFVDEGLPMKRLLQAALSRGIAPDYVRRILAAFPAEEPARSKPAEMPLGLVEPLSKRELEVLQRIAEGLTNRQIAERLYLSLNTVKVHTRNIYGKLGVHSRTQAAVRARELDLLSS